MGKMIKKLSLMLFLAMTSLMVTAKEIPLRATDFRLGDFNEQGVKYKVSFANKILTVEIDKSSTLGNGTYGAILTTPAQKMVGMGVRFRGEVRYTDIGSDASGPFWGGKIMATNFRQGQYNFFVSPVLRGTKTEWQPISLECDFPADQQSAHIVFGMQQAYGKIEFRNLVYEAFPIAPITNVKLPPNFKCQYTDRVTKDIARRGVMTPAWSRLTEQDIHDLAKWNVNLIRYQIVDGCPDAKNIEVYTEWFNSALDHIEKLMPLLKKYDIKVIIDMHHVIGGRCGKNGAKLDPSHFWAMENTQCRNAFIKLWKATAQRFKGNDRIYAFDLCNEPIQHGKAKHSFWDLQYDAAKAIRSVDPEVPIMVESNHMANPIFFEMQPMPLKNIIYSIHMYAPGDYTHQGVNDTSYTKQFYAKKYDYRNAGWDRARLAESMKAVRKFEKQYGAKIQVGEFSVVIWAPGGAAYLNDLVSIFEEYKWDWTYHAFREWDGWSLEHEGRPDAMWKAQNPTDRLQTMLKFWGKDKK